MGENYDAIASPHILSSAFQYTQAQTFSEAVPVTWRNFSSHWTMTRFTKRRTSTHNIIYMMNNIQRRNKRTGLAITKAHSCIVCFKYLYITFINGVKRTPLHMLLGHALYARDRSRSLLTAFNRIGACTATRRSRQHAVFSPATQ